MIIVFFALFIIDSQTLMSQQNSPLRFFPHSVGNKWFYHTLDPMVSYRTEITKDSIGADGSIYLFYNNNIRPLYKIDKINYFIYELDAFFGRNAPILLYKLNANVRDVWLNPSATITQTSWLFDIDTLQIWGASRIVRTYYFSPGFADSTDTTNWGRWRAHFMRHKLVEGIGLFQEWVHDGANLEYNLGLAIINGDTLHSLTSVNEFGNNGLPNVFSLKQNYPNPFNPVTTIEFEISRDSDVIIKVYDLLGREIALLYEGHKPAGSHNVSWDGSGLPSGVYFCRLYSEGVTKTIKMTLLK